MYRNAVWETAKVSRRLEPEDIALELQCTQGLELAPRTIESLVTWDVLGHAQCEKDRMSASYRVRGVMQAGY